LRRWRAESPGRSLLPFAEQQRRRGLLSQQRPATVGLLAGWNLGSQPGGGLQRGGDPWR